MGLGDDIPGMFVAAVIFGFFFLALGVVFNPKIISTYFSSDGLISPYYQKLVYVYEAVFILAGAAILISLYKIIKKNNDRRAAGKQVLGKILLLSVNVVVAVILFEIIFRLPIIKNITGGNSPEIIKINNSVVKLNNFGFRDVDWKAEKDSGTFRIAAVGDSFTFGQGVKFEEIFAKRLEAALNTAETKKALLDGCKLSIRCIRSVPEKFEILNFGQSGYSTADELKLVKEKVLGFNPDLLLIGFVLNDPDPGDDQIGAYPPEYGLVLPFGLEHQLEMNSYFYSFVKDRWNRVLEKYYFKQSYYEWQRLLYNQKWEPWQKEREALGGFAELSNSEKIPIVMVILPSMFDFKNYPYAGEHQLIEKTARELGFEVTDLLPYFKDEDAEKLRVTVSDSHPNGRANKIFTEGIFNFLVSNWLKIEK